MSVEAEAKQILTRVRAMVADHRVTRGVGYICEASLPTLKAAPMCNGFEACAIGALYLSAGVKPRRNGKWLGVRLPGTDRTDAYVARHGSPALKLAYAALNDAATRAMKRIDSPFAERDEDSAIERYFECVRPTTEQMLKCVESARRSIKVPA